MFIILCPLCVYTARLGWMPVLKCHTELPCTFIHHQRLSVVHECYQIWKLNLFLRSRHAVKRKYLPFLQMQIKMSVRHLHKLSVTVIACSSSCVLPEHPAAGEHGVFERWVGRVSEGAAEIKGGGGWGARQGCRTTPHSLLWNEEGLDQVYTPLIRWCLWGCEGKKHTHSLWWHEHLCLNVRSARAKWSYWLWLMYSLVGIKKVLLLHKT